MTNFNENEITLLKAVVAHELNDIHEKMNGYYRDDMYSEMVETLEDYETMLKLMDEFESNGDVLNYLDEYPYMGTFKRYLYSAKETVKWVAEVEGLEEYAENVIKFLKSPQVDYTKEKI